MQNRAHPIASLLTVIAIASTAGCYGGPEGSAEASDKVIAEVQLSATRRIVFVDTGDGRVGVAEIASMKEAPFVTSMLRYERATPLEIFLATAQIGEAAPEILMENHQQLALKQGREDLTPRHSSSLQVNVEALDWDRKGTTSCTLAGWEGPAGIWSNPLDSWDNQFHNVTSPWTNNTTYPRSQSITQSSTWNDNSGSYHSHGACLAGDTGADDKVTFTVRLGLSVQFTWDLEESPEDNYVIYNDYYDTGDTTESRITNAGNSSATFRHSAAAWVPIPG
ncbi:hypothetical protein [Chondromyces crocatus]|uniref:Uncharacterized protein n=1 Tax=Chondromyces crocatus TaxID=52 RepID=A0A0K1EMI9_CHOCO|nr:hypothetical protein [Chondromyces crocatus]AKT42041.1 uncharacterized protein CMC5_062640 [Chondromyces crocatus]